MPDEWKLRILARMQERGITRVELARKIGVTQGAVTQMLRLSTDQRPGTKTSPKAPLVAEILGEPLPPLQSEGDADIEEAVSALRALRSMSRATFEAQMQGLRETVEEQRKLVRRARHPKRK